MGAENNLHSCLSAPPEPEPLPGHDELEPNDPKLPEIKEEEEEPEQMKEQQEDEEQLALKLRSGEPPRR